jgi:hypothetical protein
MAVLHCLRLRGRRDGLQQRTLVQGGSIAVCNLVERTIKAGEEAQQSSLQFFSRETEEGIS